MHRVESPPSPLLFSFIPKGCPSWMMVKDSSVGPSSSSSSASGSGREDQLPSLFKHKLAFYLSRFCSVGFIQSLACHLYGQGMTPTDIYELGVNPLPSSLEEMKEHVEVLSSSSTVVRTWPSDDSPTEKALLWCSVLVAHCGGPAEIVTLLKHSLSPSLYTSLSSLISLIASTQKWMEFNPESDATTMQVLMKDASLSHFLSNYLSIVHAQTNRHLWRQEEAIKELTVNKELAEASSAAKSQFLANMSHEIRQPMNGVLGMARLLQQTPLSDEQWEYVRSISQSGETLLNIINDILDMSKIEKNMLQLEVAPFNVRECLADTLATFNVAAQQKSIHLSSFVDPSIPSFVIQDKSRVSQVLFNLIGNALKFTGESGLVGVTLMRSRKKIEEEEEEEEEETMVLEFCVSDTGCGITDGFKKKLFAPFCQFFHSSRGGGTGLGLAISQNLVRLMQGKIWLESEHQKGSKFFFTISAGSCEEMTSSPPRPSAPYDMSNLSPLPRDCKVIPPVPTSKFKILVVDDDLINLRVMARMLHKLGQDDVQTAQTGVETLVSVEETHFDIIFMDVYLGEMDGMEVTKRIHKNLAAAQRARPAIIAVSASAFSEDRVQCLNAGMQDFLPKPIKLEELAHLLVKWQRKI